MSKQTTDEILVGRGDRILTHSFDVLRRHLEDQQHSRSPRLSFMTGEHHRVRDFAVAELPRFGRALPPEHIAERTGLRLDRVGAILDDLEREFRASYDEVGWQRTQACERAASTLGGLSSLGVRNFVVTNKPKAPTEKILARLRLDGFCSGVVCRDSVSPPLASKSDVVRHTMQKFALLGSETLVVGDSVDDARAAQACGMRFVAMSQGYGGAHCQSEAPVAAVCAALSELLPLVATWRQPSRGEP